MVYFTGDYYSDSYLMFNYLTEIPLVTGSERRGSKFFNNKNKSESSKIGYTWRKRRGTFEREYCPIQRLYKTSLNQDYPHLIKMFKEYGKLHFEKFENFEFNEITINKMCVGTSVKQHLDKTNVGDSILVAFGDYTGGNTIIQNKSDNNFIVVDARDCPIKFNGAERKHSVSTIQSGIRYSLVFYKNAYPPRDKY